MSNESRTEQPHYFGHRKRLRSRVLRFLKDVEEYELVEVLLMYAQPRKDMKAMAKALLSSGSIRFIVQIKAENCSVIKGFGKQLEWYSTFLTELAMRYLIGYKAPTTPIENTSAITNPHSTIEYITKKGIFLQEEAFWVICLDASNNPIQVYNFDFRLKNKDFLAFILEVHPSAIILAKKVHAEQYNPNAEDISLLQEREKGLVLFDIALLDYIICTNSDAISLHKYSLLKL